MDCTAYTPTHTYLNFRKFDENYPFCLPFLNVSYSSIKHSHHHLFRFVNIFQFVYSHSTHKNTYTLITSVFLSFIALKSNLCVQLRRWFLAILLVWCNLRQILFQVPSNISVFFSLSLTLKSSTFPIFERDSLSCELIKFKLVKCFQTDKYVLIVAFSTCGMERIWKRKKKYKYKIKSRGFRVRANQ